MYFNYEKKYISIFMVFGSVLDFDEDFGLVYNISFC